MEPTWLTMLWPLVIGFGLGRLYSWWVSRRERRPVEPLPHVVLKQKHTVLVGEDLAAGDLVSLGGHGKAVKTTEENLDRRVGTAMEGIERGQVAEFDPHKGQMRVARAIGWPDRPQFDDETMAATSEYPREQW